MTVKTLPDYWRENGITSESSEAEAERVAADWYRNRYPWMAASDINRKARAVAPVKSEILAILHPAGSGK